MPPIRRSRQKRRTAKKNESNVKLSSAASKADELEMGESAVVSSANLPQKTSTKTIIKAIQTWNDQDSPVEGCRKGRYYGWMGRQNKQWYPGLHKFILKTHIRRKIANPVRIRDQPILARSVDAVTVASRKIKLTRGLRGGKTVDRQVQAFTEILHRQTDPWVFLLQDPVHWPSALRTKAARMDIRARAVLRQFRQRGLLPVGAQVTCGVCITTPKKEKQRIGTAADVVCFSLDKKLVVIELKIDSVPWFTARQYLMPPLEEFYDTWYTRHQLQLAYTTRMLQKSQFFRSIQLALRRTVTWKSELWRVAYDVDMYELDERLMHGVLV